MVKIFVGNVASETTEAELRALFEEYGSVSDCDILKNYGFVHMDEEAAAQKAVSALHKHELNGSRITVEYATTKVRNATKIYVGNVPEGVAAARIKELFQPFGKVVECDIVKNFAFVHMQRESEALEAISELNHTKLEGQKIFVSLSRSNPSRNVRGEEYSTPPAHHYPPHPHFFPPRPPPHDYYAPRAQLPPPHSYSEGDMYHRGFSYDPYAAAVPHYYERDPYDRRPPARPVTPPLTAHYYRERSPVGERRSLLPPPPPSSATFTHGFTHSGAAPVPPPPSSTAAPHYQHYAVSSGFETDDYLEDKYSNGFSSSY